MIILYALITIAGLAGLAIDAYLNVEYIMNDGMITGTVLYTAMLSIASMLALLVGGAAWKQGKDFIAICCLVGWLSAQAFSIPLSIARYDASINANKGVVAAHNQKVDMLKSELTDVRNLRISESERGGCGPKCQKLLAKESNLSEQLREAGVVKVDSLNDTIASGLPWLAIMAMLLLSNAFVTFGGSTFIAEATKLSAARRKRLNEMNGNKPVKKRQTTRRTTKPKPTVSKSVPKPKPTAKAKPKSRTKAKPAANSETRPKVTDFMTPETRRRQLRVVS